MEIIPWVNNAVLRTHRFLTKNLRARCKIPLFKLFAKEFSMADKII